MGGRYYADGSDTIHVVPVSNLPAAFTETRFPLRVERLALAPDSGGAGQRRGGLGYLKEFRVLRDGYFLSVADRSILGCWGLAGGHAGEPFKVSERAAREDYGVVVRVKDGASFDVDAPATSALRARLRAARAPRPFFDRGPATARSPAATTPTSTGSDP